MIQFAIEMLVLLLGIYYVTVFLHFFGILKVFKKAEINPLTALIPFYYWFKREIIK
jgi:uncharacterized membrane protein (Fun14 family)